MLGGTVEDPGESGLEVRTFGHRAVQGVAVMVVVLGAVGAPAELGTQIQVADLLGCE